MTVVRSGLLAGPGSPGPSCPGGRHIWCSCIIYGVLLIRRGGFGSSIKHFSICFCCDFCATGAQTRRNCLLRLLPKERSPSSELARGGFSCLFRFFIRLRCSLPPLVPPPFPLLLLLPLLPLLLLAFSTAAGSRASTTWFPNLAKRSGANLPCMTLASSLHRCMVGRGSKSRLSWSEWH
jgi:hypothetical protein